MNKFKQWYYNNQQQISWFLIGFLVSAGFTDLARGDYTSSAVSFLLAYLNYKLN